MSGNAPGAAGSPDDEPDPANVNSADPGRADVDRDQVDVDPADLDPAESFLEGLRDAGLRPDGGRRTTRKSTAGRPHGEPGRGRPDRGASGGRPQEGTRVGIGPRLDESCPVTAAIRDATALGTVAHAGPALERRFGTERRVRCTADGASRRVDVRAHRRPDGADGSFADALRGQLCRWATVSDVDGVVPVVDRGGDDRPWVATGSTGPTLCGREAPSVTRALRQACHLASALATLHDRGVVHAGIDPGNVVFTLGADGPPRPAFHNPGLVDVYRRYEDPATVLDPRYAAPEYFESERGIVDRATDVYQLGTVCFRLFTGVAPFAGSPETIAERVTADDPLPRPASVEPRLPEAVDEVVRTATATDKYERYDTAHEFYETLSSIGDRA